MCDHAPNDDTVLRQPAALGDLSRFGWAPGEYQCFSCNGCGRAFEGAKRSFLCRSCAEKMATASRSTDAQPGEARQPAAPIIPQDIAEMLRKLRLARKEVHTLPNSAARLYGDAADAIEALTAKNQRLTDALNQTVHEATAAIDDDLKPEIKRLTAENARLTRRMEAACGLVERGAVRAWNDTHYRTEPMSDDRKRVVETHDMFRQAMDLLDQGAPTDHDWYARHRSQVEADHAAAVQAKRQAERAKDDDALSAVAMRDLVDAAGIDMGLLGKLCREEPDEDTKREVAEMMSGISESPLSHPDYPALMAEALRQAKGGD